MRSGGETLLEDAACGEGLGLLPGGEGMGPWAMPRAAIGRTFGAQEAEGFAGIEGYGLREVAGALGSSRRSEMAAVLRNGQEVAGALGSSRRSEMATVLRNGREVAGALGSSRRSEMATVLGAPGFDGGGLGTVRPSVLGMNMN